MYKPIKPSPKVRVTKATERPTGGTAIKAPPHKDTEISLQRRKCEVVVIEERIPVWAQRGLFKQPGLGPRLKGARLAGRIKT